METTCGSLLSELQKIWDEVGEPGSERDRMLLELEQECLEAYRRKVDQASQCRAQLRKAVADSEAELADIYSAIGERPFNSRQSVGSLKEELDTIVPLLDEMRKRKFERRGQFVEVLDKIKNISKETCESIEDNPCPLVINESDLSLKRLEELHIQLLALQKEKSDRLKQVLDHLNALNSLCLVLGVNYKQTISEIHPTLDDPIGTKDTSKKTLEMLSAAIQRLQEVKIQRLLQLQDLATTMVELWTLMDTQMEEQLMFQNVTKNIAVSENEITETNALSVDFINYAKEEVSRLQQMKSSKMKELILKKRSDLEEWCRKAHMIGGAQSTVDYSVEIIESGTVEPSSVLEHIELQISKFKEEAFSRKDILDKVEKWLAAREEECWLEEYNRDDNRYNAGRGTHLILKRAEKARVAVNKIPSMVEALTSKATAWEKERGVEFLYDGVRLLSMLEKYTIVKQEKEQERQRQRDQKKLQGQLLAEQEVLFGSKPSPTKSGRKATRTSTSGGINRRLSLGGAMLQNSNPDKPALSTRLLIKKNSLKQFNSQNHHESDGLVDLPSAGKEIHGIGGLQAKKQQIRNSSNASEIKATLIRKPLSPVNSGLLSNTNTTNIRDQTMTENPAPRKTLTPTSKSPVTTTPPKTRSAAEDENRTPRTMPIPLPTTPSTVSAAMQTATTPAMPCVVPRGGEDIEYSFEERRASFVLPKSYLKSLLQF